MLSKLARIGSPCALGIFFSETQAHACLVASTPLGIQECQRHSLPIDLEKPAEGIKALVAKFGKSPENLPVAIGLPVERTYFTTRPIHAGGGEASPRVLLREALRSSRVPVDEMLVDVFTSQPDHRTVASIVSCDREFVASLTEPLSQLGFRLERAEPAPCALLRVANQVDRAHRRARVACRIFLSDDELLAVLTARNQPILWRRSKLPRGDEAGALLAAVRSLVTTGEQSGVETRPEVVVVHGRSDLLRLIDADWIRRELDARFDWIDGPPLCADVITRGLAEGCFAEQAEILDLARSMKAKPKLRELFPWREVATHVVVLGALLAFLGYELLMARDDLTSASVRNSQSTLASLPRQELENQKRTLRQKVAAVDKFVQSRVTWSNYERALANVLPDNMFLTSVHGEAELPRKAGSKQKRQLVIQGAISMPQDGLIPHEIDRLLNKLRTHTILTEDFPVIELAELKQFKRPRHNDTLAMFTVVCLPKGVKKAR